MCHSKSGDRTARKTWFGTSNRRSPTTSTSRRDVDERASAKGIEVIGRDVREATVYDQGGVKITAFLVDHGPVTHAFGYRVDHDGRSVAISGDTRPSDNLVKVSKGVDVLIHEAVDEASLRKLVPSQRLFDRGSSAERACAGPITRA
jgi:ribonuclease BN (tRNA processing enzyme)